MAIDTDVKRLSVIQLKMPFRMTLPFPTGTVTSPDRFALAGAYAGTAFAPPVPPSNNRIIIGLSMVQSGLSILSGITTQLIKGLVEDELNNITR